MAVGFCRARGLKFAIHFGATMAQAVCSRLLSVLIAPCLLARVAKIDDVTHRLPPDDNRVCEAAGPTALSPVILR